VPCTDATCNGKRFYAAESDTALSAAFDSIFASIVGEFNSLCDDSCYANGCPAGEICVQAACKTDPCASLDGLCAPGDYCFTDGNSAGVCSHVCPICPTGQSCVNGVCTPDPCATASCVKGQMCQNGACVNDPCAKVSCDQNYLCKNGQCVDDPCHFITCPANSTCIAGTGQCMGSAAVPSGGKSAARAHGCAFTDGGGVAAPALLLIFLLLALRRRAANPRRPPC
jgi:MYXO-CTERM domain-containing protein